MNTSIAPRPDRTSLGVALIVFAVFLMSIQEALFKKFSADLSLWQVFSLRGILAIPLICVVGYLRPQSESIWTAAMGKWALLRSLYMTLMFISMYSAIPFISLSSVAAGIYSAPVFVSLMSAYAIGEPVSKRGWLAVLTGFSGVLIILQPGSDSFVLWALLPLFGGFMYALANVTTRSMCQDVSVAALALSLNIALLLTGLVISIGLLVWQPSIDLQVDYPYLFGGWATPGISEWTLIAVLAVLVVVIGMGLAGAYQNAAPAVVATFDYSYLVFMVLWDYLLFSIVPGFTTLIGISLIVVAGFLVMKK